MFDIERVGCDGLVQEDTGKIEYVSSAIDKKTDRQRDVDCRKRKKRSKSRMTG